MSQQQNAYPARGPKNECKYLCLPQLLNPGQVTQGSSPIPVWLNQRPFVSVDRCFWAENPSQGAQAFLCPS